MGESRSHTKRKFFVAKEPSGGFIDYHQVLDSSPSEHSKRHVKSSLGKCLSSRKAVQKKSSIFSSGYAPGRSQNDSELENHHSFRILPSRFQKRGNQKGAAQTGVLKGFEGPPFFPGSRSSPNPLFF
ncbi:hypothetical protein JTE90_010326 [Oedothorax gibbosus]|uniref:Uncharacterized protein n=1 Tax=Oedothorax gibbosus TaxID=931172 RepID=A0AAV6TDI6_9ARAC|nr:hypothetical protein JTE90_010326 [Oedothorax gibbosus]